MSCDRWAVSRTPVTGRWQPNAKVALVEWARKLLADVEATGRTVHWVHVKGHSADDGNDRADELVQWGKGDGPHCRLREGGGEGASRYGAATTAALPTEAMGLMLSSSSFQHTHRVTASRHSPL